MGARVIGIDTGGTFTDLVAVGAEGQVQVAKVSSTPENPADAILAGISELGGLGPGDRIVHGTTVALNALLTGKTARVAFVTGRGFRDLIEVGRQERPDIYALEPERPRPLVERSCRFEIDARIWPAEETGSSLGEKQNAGARTVKGFALQAEPKTEELLALARHLKRSGVTSVAIGLLHSWADPRQEKLVAKALEHLGLPLTCSGVILPEHREVERFSTALVNAALIPVMRHYLESLRTRLAGAPLAILQSSGGTLPAERAALEPVRVILSGPAGGVIGAAEAVRDAGFDAFVGLDMGGTSTDVAFHRANLDSAFLDASKPLEPIRIAGHPVAVPTLDIHTIGCGGGSIVNVDRGGVLHVGPESAGADPGPIAYGGSDRLTVTDAHVFLGHIASGEFLGGALTLDLDAVERAFELLAQELGIDPVQAAEGVLEVARAAMQRAIGVMTMQRGKDPAGLPLVAFGGAGGLQAAALAGAMHMQAALVPAHPGALSAFGMTRAAGLADRTHAVVEDFDLWPLERRRALQKEMGLEARQELIDGGAAARSVVVEQALELRYRGQSFEVRVPDSKAARETFETTHKRLFGYRLEGRDLELVCLRTRATIRRSEQSRKLPRRRALPKRACVGSRSAWFQATKVEATVIARAELAPGHFFGGPALIEEYSGTTLVPPNWNSEVTQGGHLLLRRNP